MNSLHKRIITSSVVMVIMLVILFILSITKIIAMNWTYGYMIGSATIIVIFYLQTLKDKSLSKHSNIYLFVFFMILIHGLYLVPFIFCIYKDSVFSVYGILIGVLINTIFSNGLKFYYEYNIRRNG
ncbi:MG406 family protein [Spiroplasma endosymbiont of Othius punctulatus]|uniref:MG406 family protein n=1 Tax=Spiroplasma endosymbiont of Othius punctulatus TaxID=3066289 RepID=UPI0030CE6858